MGNFFRRNYKDSQYDKDLIVFLKNKTQKDFEEVIVNLQDNFSTNLCFNLEEYEDAFGLYFDNFTEKVFLLLENSHNNEGQVDLYETLATMLIFSNDDYDQRLQYIFSLFDFDKSGQIELKELVLSNQASIRALCKIVNLPPPSLEEIEDFTQYLFNKVDIDRSKSISFKEYCEWVKNNWELQDFFLKYAEVQTFENAERLTREAQQTYTKIFQSISNKSEFVKVSDLQNKLKSELKIEQASLNKLIQILLETTKEQQKSEEIKDQIHIKSYDEIMKAWAAFSGTDINGDNSISLQELKFLIYAYEGDIPDNYRIQEEMEQLDQDKSGFVSRIEWLIHLCSDPSSSGNFTFRANLKQLFKQFDKDNSGYLNKQELIQLLKYNLQQHTTRYQVRGGQQLENFEEIIQGTCDDIISQLDASTDKLSWVQFKSFMDKAYKTQEKLKKFLSTFK